jgi:hypothetical protein
VSEACHDVPASWRRCLRPGGKNIASPFGPALNRQTSWADTWIGLSADGPESYGRAGPVVEDGDTLFSAGIRAESRFTEP